jgi:hypothetical protein
MQANDDVKTSARMQLIVKQLIYKVRYSETIICFAFIAVIGTSYRYKHI